MQGRQGSKSTPARSCAPDRSYTVLTLEELRDEAPMRPLALIVGADAFLGLPAWHRWRELFELAHVIVVARPGTALDLTRAPSLLPDWERRRTDDVGALAASAAGAIVVQPVTPHDISATSIRSALARGGRRHRLRAPFASACRFGLY